MTIVQNHTTYSNPGECANVRRRAALAFMFELRKHRADKAAALSTTTPARRYGK